MIETIHHIVRISARRDRTEINAALMDAIDDLFHPHHAKLFQCYPGSKQMMVFDCAGLNGERPYVRNAYLPDRRFCQSIDTFAHLKRCRREDSVILDVLDDGSHRLVFPVGRQGEPIYMVEIVLPEEFAADGRVSLMGLIEYFGNHIALLNYGEADTLTGLASRKTFEKHLFELLGRANQDSILGDQQPKRRSGTEQNSRHWLAVCDIDHFKSINDNFGHLIGDEVLIMMGQLMRKSFRFDDQLFRFGGEEFIVVLQPASRESAQKTFDRFREDVANQVFSRVGHVTISIGFSQLLPYDTPNDVIDRADEGLYFAKQHGRNRVDNYESLIEAGSLTPKHVEKGEVELF